jgi:chromosome segregation ATPase
MTGVYEAHLVEDVIPELRAEVERLTAERDRWQHDALGWSDRLTDATAEIERWKSRAEQIEVWVGEYRARAERAEAEVERLTSERDVWKIACNAQAAEVDQLRREIRRGENTYAEGYAAGFKKAEGK